MAEVVKNNEIELTVSEGIRLGCLRVDEQFNGLGEAESDFLDFASAHLAKTFGKKLNKLAAWEMLKELRELTKTDSAKAAVLSVVNEGAYPIKLAEFRKANFNYIQEAYRYIVSMDSPQTAEVVQNTQTTETPAQVVVNAHPKAVPTVQPFTVGEHTVPIQNMVANIEGMGSACDDFIKSLESPELMAKAATPIMTILNTLNQNPDSVINLLNGISALLTTPAPTTQQPHTCTCGQH